MVLSAKETNEWMSEWINEEDFPASLRFFEKTLSPCLCWNWALINLPAGKITFWKTFNIDIFSIRVSKVAIRITFHQLYLPDYAGLSYMERYEIIHSLINNLDM